MRIPTFNPCTLVCNEPELAAQLSVALSMKGTYLPLMDGPRLSRHDAEGEVIRRTNAIAAAQSKKIVVVGCSEQVSQSLKGRVPAEIVKQVGAITEDALQPAGIKLKSGAPVQVNRKSIGPALLLALRAKRQLEFVDDAPEIRRVPGTATHLVVCEDENLLTQVIAANYAFAVGAGLQLISSPNESFVEDISERFYGAKNDEDGSTTSKLELLAHELRDRLQDLDFTRIESLTFITSGIPWGFAVQECPTTHLFAYPDLGLSIIHGIAASLDNARPVRMIAMIDSGLVQSKEVVNAGRRLIERGPLIMAFRNERANVRSVSHLLDLIPYDLLFIATHCGDVKGHRETYRFTDSSGRERTLVLDVAMQVDPKLRYGKVQVKAYQRYVSIDGVPWENKDARMLIVGSALKDFYSKRLSERMPISREPIERIVGSAGLAMSDGNLLATPTNAGDNGYPFIFNNACVSWHKLAQRFMFGGARGYIGTLISVADSEAQEVAMGVLDTYFGRPLAHALWSTQKKVSGNGVRRPYVMVGVHFQRLRSTLERPHPHILERLVEAHRYWSEQMPSVPDDGDHARADIADRVTFLRDCIDELRSGKSTNKPEAAPQMRQLDGLPAN